MGNGGKAAQTMKPRAGKSCLAQSAFPTLAEFADGFCLAVAVEDLPADLLYAVELADKSLKKSRAQNLATADFFPAGRRFRAKSRCAIRARSQRRLMSLSSLFTEC